MRNIIITNKTNIKNYFSVIALSIALVLIAILSTNNVRAQQQQEQGGIPAEQSLLSQPLLIDYKSTTIKQEGDKVEINARVTNSGAPSNFGLVLVISKLGDGRISFIDQKVLGNIYVDASSVLSISYNIPDFLVGGEYITSLRVLLSGGGMIISEFLPVKEFIVKDKLVTNLPLDGGKCKLVVEGDTLNRIYGLLEGPDISKDEKINLSCDTKGTNLEGEYMLNYSNSLRAMGATNTTTFKDRSILVKNNTLSFDLDTEKLPQAYDYLFYLTKNESRVTPYMQAHYVIQGESATIQDVKYGKDKNSSNYTFEVSAIGPATNFPGARVASSTLKANIKFYIYDEIKNIYKAEQVKNLTGDMQKLYFSIPSDRLEKASYKGVVKIYDSDNRNLSEKEFIFDLNYANNKKIEINQDGIYSVLAKEVDNDKTFLKYMSYFIVLISVVILVFIYNRYKSSGTVSKLLSVLLASLTAIFIVLSTYKVVRAGGPGSTPTAQTLTLYADLSKDVVSALSASGGPGTSYNNTALYDTGTYNYLEVSNSPPTCQIRGGCNYVYTPQRGENFSVRLINNFYLNKKIIGSWDKGQSTQPGYGSRYWNDRNGQYYFTDSQLVDGSNTIDSVFTSYYTGNPPLQLRTYVNSKHIINAEYKRPAPTISIPTVNIKFR